MTKPDKKRPYLKEITVTRYPFARWFSKAQSVLRRGYDYDVESKQIAQQIRNAANDCQMDVSLKVRTYAVSVTVWDLIEVKKGKR